MKKEFNIRPMKDEDYPFIFNSWLKSYSKEWIKHKSVPSNIYYQGQHKIIQRLLSNCLTLVATAIDDDNLVIGYINYTKVDGVYVVNYVYVKYDFRGLGVGKSLLSETELQQDSIYTHWTSCGADIANKYGIIHHPFFLMSV